MREANGFVANVDLRTRQGPPSMILDDDSMELSQLRKENEALRVAVRARDDFIAIASHELRNPMQPILGTAELALDVAWKSGNSCPEQVVVLLGRMKKLVDDYVRRATTLLDATRIEAGNLRLRSEPVSLSEVVLEAVERYEAIAAGAGSALNAEVEPGIFGSWDQLAIEQIADNLIANAIKFGANHPVGVRLSSVGQAARLEVQDQGVGMTPEQQSHIFGRFEQVVGSRQGGFGIGLWVANRLAIAMGGEISVSSRPNEGATFTVELPLEEQLRGKAQHARNGQRRS